MSITTAALAAANVRNPVFWEQSFMVNISNPTGVPTLVPSTSYMTSSQDFQGIYVDSNSRSSPNVTYRYPFLDLFCYSNTKKKLQLRELSLILAKAALHQTQQLKILHR